jgi:hypothetical protein
VNTDPAFALSCGMRPVPISRCDGVGKSLKKSTPGWRPGTSRMQSGALSSWLRCSVWLLVTRPSFIGVELVRLRVGVWGARRQGGIDTTRVVAGRIRTTEVGVAVRERI